MSAIKKKQWERKWPCSMHPPSPPMKLCMTNPGNEGKNCTFRHFLHVNAVTLSSETTWTQEVWPKQAFFSCFTSSDHAVFTCDIRYASGGACWHEVKGMFFENTAENSFYRGRIVKRAQSFTVTFNTWTASLLPNYCSFTAKEEKEGNSPPTRAGQKCTKTM